MNKNSLNKIKFNDIVKISDETKECIKRDFKGITGKLEVDLNEGGIRAITVNLKLK